MFDNEDEYSGKSKDANKEENSGEWKKDQHHEIGTCRYNNGMYTGEWKDGNQHGLGTFKCYNGDEYSGEWTEGNHHDQGTCTFTHREVYSVN